MCCCQSGPSSALPVITIFATHALPVVIVVRPARPLGAQLDDRVVEIDADAAAHADDHRLAVHRLEPALVVLHQIGGDELDALRIADQRLQRGPLRLELLLARQLFAFGDLFELLVDLRQLACVQPELGDAALVVDRHRGLVGDGALDVVDADVVAEDRARVGVGLLDRRAGEADERGVRQRIAQIAREAVDQVVLAAVRFIGDHDDVAALREQRRFAVRFSGTNF